MRDIKLKRDYISIDRDTSTSFGGSQTWSESKRLRDYGCGLIAATDVLLYLGAAERIITFAGGDGREATKSAVYSADFYSGFTKWFEKYFLVLPKLGMSGLFLVLGFYRCFRKLHMPYKIRWGVFPKRLRSVIKGMLEADIPVILSIGPNFPKLWGKEGVMLYTKNADENYRENQKTRAHYVTVTGIEGDYLQISSWGRCYYIRWDEYKTYRWKGSLPLFTNICYIQKR